MVWWKFGAGINKGFLAILAIFVLQIKVFLRYIEFLWERLFLVRGGDKKCGEYKNKNWVGIWDLINIRGTIFDEKKW